MQATLEGHQRAIMGNMSVEEIYKDRKTFSERVSSSFYSLFPVSIVLDLFS